jgi:hypothetical protein
MTHQRSQPANSIVRRVIRLFGRAVGTIDVDGQRERAGQAVSAAPGVPGDTVGPRCAGDHLSRPDAFSWPSIIRSSRSETVRPGSLYGDGADWPGTQELVGWPRYLRPSRTGLGSIW